MAETSVGGLWEGGFSFIRLPSYRRQRDNVTVTASFAGDHPTNATAYDNTLDGEQYPACTTVQ
ncbi:MAG: hypothetical protein WCD81_06645 [Candidatus Bathyarchaeia archaeon]